VRYSFLGFGFNYACLLIAVASLVAALCAVIKPRDELRRIAAQLISWFCVLTRLAIALRERTALYI